MRSNSPTSDALALGLLLLTSACAGDADRWGPTGVTRSFTMTATSGAWDLRMDGGMVMATLDGYHLDGQFLGPTLVVDAGDTLEVTLVNQTDAPMGLHPHGVRYDKDNEGMDRVAPAGGEVTYVWEATNGPGTFPYHSHELDDELREYQGMAGVLGAIVIQDPTEPPPDLMVNWFLMNTYAPWTTVDPDAMEGEGGHGAAAEPDTAADTDTTPAGGTTVHNHTMVVQEVRPSDDGWTTTTKPLLTATASLGQDVRANVIGFGEEMHVFHTHGYTWTDPATGGPIDARAVGPAESFSFRLDDLDNPGLWMVHCHVDSHLHMMSTWLLVQ